MASDNRLYEESLIPERIPEKLAGSRVARSKFAPRCEEDL
jgi:hypothetical protein